MKRGWFFLLVLSLGLNVGFLYNQFGGDADDSRGGRRPHPAARNGRPASGDLSPDQLIEGRLARMTDALNLNEEQHQQMRVVLQEFVPPIMEYRQRVTGAHGQMIVELSAPTADPERVRALTAELTTAQAALDSLVAESLLKEFVFLTKEQRIQYREHLPVPGGRRRGPPKP